MDNALQKYKVGSKRVAVDDLDGAMRRQEDSIGDMRIFERCGPNAFSCRTHVEHVLGIETPGYNGNLPGWFDEL